MGSHWIPRALHISKIQDTYTALSLEQPQSHNKALEFGLLASTETLGIVMDAAAGIVGEVGLDVALDSVLGVLSVILCSI